MYNDVREFVAHCETWYQVKANTHAKKAKVQIREIPKTLFHTIHLDHLKLAVPNASHQYNYVLIIIDELSLQVEISPPKPLLQTNVQMHFLTMCLYRLCGINHMLISTKNPRSNGLCEQVNSRIINAIKIHCSTNSNWPHLLPAIAGAYRAAVTPTRQFSPFYIMYGFDIKMPSDFECANSLPANERQDPNMDIFRDRMKILRTEVQQFAQDKRERATFDINKTKTESEYKIGQKVYLANEAIKPDEYRKSAVRFTGPYLIIGKSKHNTYKLSHIYTGKILKSFIHFDKLKPTTEQRKTRNTTKQETREGDESKQNIANIEVKRTSKYAVKSNNNGNSTTDREHCTDSKQPSELPNYAITTFAFNNYFDVCDEHTNDNDDISVESTELPPQENFTERRLHNRHSEMKRILKIARINGCLRCHVLLNTGERIVCRPVQVPSDLLCHFRLNKYYKKHR